MSNYYKVDSRKITLREYWNIYPSVKVLIPWLLGRLNVRTGEHHPMYLPDSFCEMEVPEESLQPEARAAFLPLVAQCQRLGFHSPRYYFFGNLRQTTRVSFVSLLHKSGQCSVRLMHTLATQVQPPVQRQLVVLQSELADGTLFFTTDDGPKFKTAPGITSKRLIGAPLERLVQSHEESLVQFSMQNPARLMPSLAAMDEAWNRSENLSTAFGVQRGLYQRLSDAEVAQEQEIVSGARAMTPASGEPPRDPAVFSGAKTMMPPSGEHADVLMEISALQNQKSGWAGVITILLVSLALFVAVGARQWSWKLVLLLLPILFLHELGHYLAMRAFNYRNLKMFFIPFFGAAVSGQHYNVPGWKRVIVFLMGPVPGIFLGLIVGAAGLLLRDYLLTKVALMLLVLNGFNLLPILPFDGGWVFHALLFSRHYVLDGAFRLLAALALLAGGIFSPSKVFIFLSIPMFLSIPASFRLARIAADLRRRDIPRAAEEDQSIPPETAQAIIGELKKSTPRPLPAKVVAQQALQIFETLNARPPGWPATIGFLFAHFASIGIAVVFAAIFMFESPGFRGFRRSAPEQQKHKLVSSQLQSWSGGQSSNLFSGELDTIVATLASGAKANGTFADLTNRLPPAAILKTFGQSLLLMLPADADAARKTWYAELQRQTGDIFVAGTNLTSPLKISCVAPSASAAAAIERELEEYMETLVMGSLIPPWSPADHRTPNELAQDQLARRTYLTLTTNEYSLRINPEVRELHKRISAASRQGDRAEADALLKKVRQIEMAARRERMLAVRRGESGVVDTNVVDLYLASNPDDETGAQVRLQGLAARMGGLPTVDGVVQPEAHRFSLESGAVWRKGARIELSFLHFKQIGEGAPALVQWLSRHGCVDFTYAFTRWDPVRELDIDP